MSYLTNLRKKVVVFDIDDTIADLHGFILPHLNAHAGTTHAEFTDYNWPNLFGISFEECQKVLIEQDYIRRLKLRSAMVKYWFKACQMKRLTVHFSTHRGHIEHAEEMTKEWLAQYPFIKYEKLMVLKPGERKADLFSRNTVAFFEDNLEEAIYAQEKGFKTWLIDQPWNRKGHSHPNVCKTIEDVTQAIQWT